VRRKLQLRELDNTSSNLMRLKNARIKEEVRLQKKHNKFAIRNYEHNQVLEKLNKMRTQQGLALGQLYDPKPYRFMEVNAEEQQEQEQEAEGEAETETEQDSENENEAESDAESESDASAEDSTETEAESEAESEESTEEPSQE